MYERKHSKKQRSDNNSQSRRVYGPTQLARPLHYTHGYASGPSVQEYWAKRATLPHVSSQHRLHERNLRKQPHVQPSQLNAIVKHLRGTQYPPRIPFLILPPACDSRRSVRSWKDALTFKTRRYHLRSSVGSHSLGIKWLQRSTVKNDR